MQLSDARFSLTKDNAEISSAKIMKLMRHSLSMSVFSRRLRGCKAIKNYKTNSQGIIFGVLSCQLVYRVERWKWDGLMPHSLGQ